jgi:hypothetical protein
MSAAILEMRNSDVLVAGLAHPRPVSWNFVFKRFSELLGVPLAYAEWLQKLEKQLNVPDSNPHALRLLDMYRNIKLDWGFETEATLANVANGNAAKGSKSLRNAPKLTVDDVDRWMAYWGGSAARGVVHPPAKPALKTKTEPGTVGPEITQFEATPDGLLLHLFHTVFLCICTVSESCIFMVLYRIELTNLEKRNYPRPA